MSRTQKWILVATVLASATGILNLQARDGLLPHVILTDGTGPLHMTKLAARLLLSEGKVEVQQGKLETHTGAYELGGAASLNRTLDLKLTREGASGFIITGTLTEPRVLQVSASETRAALKP